MNPASKTDTKRTLEAVLSSDQKAIREFRAGKIDAAELSRIQAENVAIVKKIIDIAGFPSMAATSLEAYKAAVMAVLHSGDAALLDQSVAILEKMDPISIQRRDIAYMIDKSRVIRNLPQLFGTQYRIEGERARFVEIESPENLEKRRAQYGMESFDAYKKTVEEMLRKR